jgi:hypothetical protein
MAIDDQSTLAAARQIMRGSGMRMLLGSRGERE